MPHTLPLWLFFVLSANHQLYTGKNLWNFYEFLSVLYLLSFYNFCEIVFRQTKKIFNFYFSLCSRPVAHEILGVPAVIFVFSPFIYTLSCQIFSFPEMKIINTFLRSSVGLFQKSIKIFVSASIIKSCSSLSAD